MTNSPTVSDVGILIANPGASGLLFHILSSAIVSLGVPALYLLSSASVTTGARHGVDRTGRVDPRQQPAEMPAEMAIQCHSLEIRVRIMVFSGSFIVLKSLRPTGAVTGKKVCVRLER